jgi:hypothetical protein
MEVLEPHNYYKCCPLNSCDSQPLVIWFMKVEEDLGATKLTLVQIPSHLWLFSLTTMCLLHMKPRILWMRFCGDDWMLIS